LEPRSAELELELELGAVVGGGRDSDAAMSSEHLAGCVRETPQRRTTGVRRGVSIENVLDRGLKEEKCGDTSCSSHQIPGAVVQCEGQPALLCYNISPAR